MTKELSIENIKKELIDKISNNSDILEYFENYVREIGSMSALKEYGTKYIKDNYIFPYDMSSSAYGSFIAVEVNEEESTGFDGLKTYAKMYYRVNIMVALEDGKALDKISVLLGKIATELYPDRFSYKNTVYDIEFSHARAIQFTIG